MKILTLFWLILLGNIAIANCLVFSEANHIGPNSVIIPFENYHALILVKAKVRGIEGNFILDTGANGLVLNSAYFIADRAVKEQALGISGGLSNFGRSSIDSFFIDRITFVDLAAENIDMNEIEKRKKTKILGLIGYDVIKDYEIMLNYRAKHITISSLDAEGQILDPLPHTLGKVDSFPFILANFIPVINVKVNEVSKKMGIDTGAEYNIIDNRRNRNILENFKVVNRINITGADGRRRQAIAGQLFRVKLDEKYKCASMATVMTNMQYLNDLYGMNLDGILGHAFLAPWLFSINYKKKMIYLHELKYDRT